MNIRNSRKRAGLALAVLRGAACAGPLLLAAGCATFPQLSSGVPGNEPSSSSVMIATDPLFPSDSRPETDGGSQQQTLPIPGRPAAPQPARQPATDSQIDALVPDELVDASLAPQSVPQFVATVFGGVLGLPYTMGNDTAARTEIISGGTGGTVTKRNLFRLAQRGLRTYGIEVYIDGNVVSIGASDRPAGSSNLVRGREVVTGGGQVVQIFNVQTIEVNALQGLLQGIFPNLGGARITPDQLSNSLIISGPSREVANVVRVVRELDQPRFAGGEALRVEPVFWAADALAASLEQTLTAEGYVVSRTAAARRGLTILAFPAANQILIFGDDPAVLSRARFWVDTLDQPAALGDKATTFVYQVRNTDAQSLGQLAIGQSPSVSQPQAPIGVPGTPPVVQIAGSSSNGRSAGRSNSADSTTGQFQNGRLITDPIGNRILFTGTASEFAQLRTLLETLDIPAPQVVIEVMIAEVTLSDATSLGVSFGGTERRGDGIATGTIGNAATTTAAGVLVTFVGPEFRARLSAEASNNKINVLQRPQLVTRSGGTARFQVGSDVPIITSQRATDFQSGGDGNDVLQSVQYRQTGTITELTPVVYGDRVDITISQEISNVSDSASAGGISSPTILNRSLTTQVAVGDGRTAVLGGLISNNATKTNTGVPFLKDIPFVGSAFQTNTVSNDRTEVLMIITPYIVRNDDDMGDFAEQYSADMNAAFRVGRGWSYTLTPFSLGRNFRGIGPDLPSATRPSDRPVAVDTAPPPTPPAPPIEIAPPA